MQADFIQIALISTVPWHDISNVRVLLKKTKNNLPVEYNRCSALKRRLSNHINQLI